jgi:hypothetical protein
VALQDRVYVTPLLIQQVFIRPLANIKRLHPVGSAVVEIGDHVGIILRPKILVIDNQNSDPVGFRFRR